MINITFSERYFLGKNIRNFKGKILTAEARKGMFPFPEI